jgi:hypothetical protein
MRHQYANSFGSERLDSAEWAPARATALGRTVS